MQIRFSCPNEPCPALIELEPLETAETRIECPRCHQQHPVALDAAVREHNQLETCPRCGGREFFVQKDFPHGLGLAMVIAAATISILYLRTLGFYAIGFLAAAALIDLGLYFVVGKVTVCYRCRAEYRKVRENPDHAPFDLATAEKYAQA